MVKKQCQKCWFVRSSEKGDKLLNLDKQSMVEVTQIFIFYNAHVYPDKCTVNRLSIITGLDCWNGPMEWTRTTVLTFFCFCAKIILFSYL